jgi:hypothetical protein
MVDFMMEVNEMPTITMFAFGDMPKLEKAVSLLSGKKGEAHWISARQHKYNQDTGMSSRHSENEERSDKIREAGTRRSAIIVLESGNFNMIAVQLLAPSSSSLRASANGSHLCR